MSEALVKPAVVAEHLQISVGHLYKLTRRQEIPHVRVGNAVRFHWSEVNAWVDAHRVAVAPAPPDPPARCSTPERHPNTRRRDARAPKGLAARTEFPEGYEPIQPVPIDV